jgi:hypothetical protein
LEIVTAIRPRRGRRQQILRTLQEMPDACRLRQRIGRRMLVCRISGCSACHFSRPVRHPAALDNPEKIGQKDGKWP